MRQVLFERASTWPRPGAHFPSRRDGGHDRGAAWNPSEAAEVVPVGPWVVGEAVFPFENTGVGSMSRFWNLPNPFNLFFGWLQRENETKQLNLPPILVDTPTPEGSRFCRLLCIFNPC